MTVFPHAQRNKSLTQYVDTKKVIHFHPGNRFPANHRENEGSHFFKRKNSLKPDEGNKGIEEEEDKKRECLGMERKEWENQSSEDRIWSAAPVT